jgi:hypothetical protein
MNAFSHPRARRQIQAMVDDRLEASKQLLLNEHLAACKECRAYANELLAIEDVLRQVGRSGNLGFSTIKAGSSAPRSGQRVITAILARYRRDIMQKRFFSIVGILATLGILAAAVILLGNLTRYPPISPMSTLVVSPPTPTENMTTIAQGDWVASTTFGRLILTVADRGPRIRMIQKISYQFSGWTCGSTTFPGEIVDASEWLISEDNRLVIDSTFDQAGMVTMHLSGTYDETNQGLSGKWEAASYDTICSGTWEASAPK